MNLLGLLVKVGVKDEASGKVKSVSSGIKSDLSSAASAAAKATSAAIAATGAAVVKIGKQAFDAYSSYEQLSGGVDKLFGNASEQLKQYAQEAYKTSGMSANQYMEQATSFSAALISSLGGDQQKAAEMTDVAMRAMSDNVNVYGSNMEDVQNAFQGFAKQNYTMLDNLKLGYGGTKQEMERLIADANEYAAATGRASDLSIDSFADIVQAIQLIQEKQGIAGTTAKEAATTIEGSINMTKAAWVNLLTELGKQDGDIPARMQELMESVTNVVSNVEPVFERAAEGIAQAAPTLIPVLIQSAADIIQTLADNLPPILQDLLLALISVLPQLVETSIQLFMGILQALVEVAPQIVDGLVTLLETLIDKLPEYLPQLIAVSMEFFQAIAFALLQKAPEILALLGRSLIDMVGNVSGRAGDMLRAGLDFIGGLLSGVGDKISELPGIIWDGLQNAVSSVFDFGGSMWDAGYNIVSSLASGIADGFRQAINAVADGMSAIRSYLPFSPAKKGAFSGRGWTLYSGRAIMQGLAEGIEKGVGNTESAMSNAMDAIHQNVSGSASIGTDVVASGANNGMNPIASQISALRQEIKDLKLVLNIDGREIAEATVGYMDRAMGTYRRRAEAR